MLVERPVWWCGRPGGVMRHDMGSGFDLLVERGFVSQSSNDDGLRAALREPTTLYLGIDATAASLHVGHLVTVMMLAHLQRAGHRPIALVGGGTTMVGDPSGRTKMRQLLTREEIARNAESIKAQLSQFVDFSNGRALMLDNADWLLRLQYVDFLREIGRHFSVNQLLQHETYRERLQSTGLSFLELNYVLLQAYDFLYLYREHGCRLQIGGGDQWFNILAGVELIRRVEGGAAFALVAPLLTTASGAKMGKTAEGAVWLSAAQTPPYDFYQFWINTEDADVGRFLRLFTFLPLHEIRRLESLTGAELRSAKEVLAFEVTRLVHGEREAERATASSRAAFAVDTVTLSEAAEVALSLSTAQLAGGVEIDELAVSAGLAASKAEVRRLVKQGGVSLKHAGEGAGHRVSDPHHRLTQADFEPDGLLLLQVGKKRRRWIAATA